MSRKLVGVILLPIPFAALPVVVVLASALFGSNRVVEDVVTSGSQPAIESFLSSDAVPADGDSLARANVNDHSQGCDFGLEGEF